MPDSEQADPNGRSGNEQRLSPLFPQLVSLLPAFGATTGVAPGRAMPLFPARFAGGRLVPLAPSRINASAVSNAAEDFGCQGRRARPCSRRSRYTGGNPLGTPGNGHPLRTRV